MADLEVIGDAGKTVDPKAYLGAALADIDSLYEQLDDAGLLGRKQLIPHPAQLV